MKNWRFRGNEQKYIKEVLKEGFKAGADGAFTTRFERALADSYSMKFAISMNSGTSTLHTALLALEVSEGDEVLVPSLTPLMCGLAIHYTRATPVYVDVDPSTFLMSPSDLAKKITGKSKVILVTHMYGNVCDMKNIMRIARESNLRVIEDCAQCHYGKSEDGKYAGTIGDFGSWSFENSKHLTCGDGGVLVTDTHDLATRVRKIGGLGFKTLTAEAGRVRTNRNLLQNPNWERFDTIGFNYRLGQLSAAVALAQVERKDHFINLRIKSGHAYREVLKHSQLLIPQSSYPNVVNTYYTFSALFNGEEKGIPWEEFREKHISFGGDGIYAASKLLYQEPIFKSMEIGRGVTPVAEMLQRRLMNFTTNQANHKQIKVQVNALRKCLSFFGEKSA
jgi:perosamine synthetase